ncbi:MAG: hypothetical protein HQL57_11720, partial [Magnetococcales bacterium]|nr:hypothetical protein [Magnetococcales bacterium]
LFLAGLGAEGWAHGPGRPLELEVAFCADQEGESVPQLRGVRAGGSVPFCLSVRNAEPLAVQLSLSLLSGSVDAAGRSTCLLPATPSRGTAWLGEGNATGVVRGEVAPGETWRGSLSLQASMVSNYPADSSGAVPFRGWLGCLLVEGRVVVPEGEGVGHKNARILRMIRGVEGSAAPAGGGVKPPSRGAEAAPGKGGS